MKKLIIFLPIIFLCFSFFSCVDENAKADFILPDFVFSEKMTISSFKIDDVDFTKNTDGSFSFSKNKFSSTDGKYEINGNNFNGTISSDGKINFTLIYKTRKM